MIPRRHKIARKSFPRRKTRVKRTNPKRKAREFARCYHSVERVEWVKTLGCVASEASPWTQRCGGQIDNAHIEIEGKDRKAHYTRIVPLCRVHHEDLASCGREMFENQHGIYLLPEANRVEFEWQKHLERTGR